MSAPTVHTFPASQALQVVTLLRRWHIGAAEVLEGTGLAESDLEAPDLRISGQTLAAIYERARALTGEPGIGFYLGMQKRLSMFGFLGFATMSAGTLGEGLELLVRYAPTVSTALTFELDIKRDRAHLFVHEHVDMGSAHDVAVLSFAVGSRQLTTAMLGRDPDGAVTDLPLPRPGYFARFAHLLPAARFDRPRLGLHFDARALSLPLVSPDRAALRLARDACERQLTELGFDNRLSARVRRAARTEDGFLGAQEVARRLHMSDRTLKRHLAAEGTSFSDVIDAARREQALALLRSPHPSLEEIARRLGYSSAPNFARAFRRWMGMSPTSYRKRGV